MLKGMSYIVLAAFHVGFFDAMKGAIISPLDAQKIGNDNLQLLLDQELIDENGEVDYEAPAPEPTPEAPAPSPAPKKKSKSKPVPSAPEEPVIAEPIPDDQV